MDASTRFILKKMEEHRLEAKADLAKVEKTLSDKIDVLWAFRLRILGASMLVSGLVGALFEYVRN